MLRWVMTVVLLVALGAPTPALARGFDNLKAGVNAVLTAPADPVMLVVTPPEKLEYMPGFQVLGRVAGLFAGTLQGGYRFLAGATDIVTTPLWIIKSYSPPPRFMLYQPLESE